MKKLGLLALGILLAGMDFNKSNKDHNSKHREIPNPEESSKKDLENKIKIYKSQGLTAFNIDGKEIWARNYKNALRKSKV